MGKAKTAKKKTTATKKPQPADPAAPAIEGSQAAYEKYLPAANALAASAVIPYRADASLAYHNVSLGVASLEARKSDAAALPDTDVASIAELPDVCLGLAFAVEQTIQSAGGSNPTLAPLFQQGSALRRKMLAGADALVEAGLLPEAKVAAIRAGYGRLDAANDLVALGALFAANAAAIRGKTAITAADATQAAKIGSQLLTLLKPTRAKKTRSTETTVAADARDRLWTIVRQRYDALWRACAYLYGAEEVGARVPALQAHVATTSARKKANAAKRAAKKANLPPPKA